MREGEGRKVTIETKTPFPPGKITQLTPTNIWAFSFSGKGYNRHSFPGQMTLIGSDGRESLPLLADLTFKPEISFETVK